MVKSLPSHVTVPVVLLNWPRTVETIMCFTANWALVWAVSICQVVPWAKSGADASASASVQAKTRRSPGHLENSLSVCRAVA